MDTSVIVAALIEGGRQYDAARSHCEMLFEAGFTVVVSDLVQIELSQAIKAVANDPSALPERERRRRKLHRWGDLRDARADWYRYCFEGYDELLDQFSSVQELSINRSLIELARDIMIDFQINSYDAIHAASALTTGASTLVTLDADYLKLADIPGLSVLLIR